MAKKAGTRRKRRSMSRKDVDEFLQSSQRARTLYYRLVENGYAVKSPGKKPTALSEPDRRDLAAFLFFEVAAKFEQLAKRTLVLEVQKTMRVNRSRAEHMVGSSAEGIPDGMGGWAHLSIMKQRAEGLLGTRSVWARAEYLLKNPTAQYLGMAVTTRNRIAHGKGNDSFTKMLTRAPVSLPPNQRKGVSPGVFLMAHPRGVAAGDTWFFRFLNAYDAWAKIVRSKI